MNWNGTSNLEFFVRSMEKSICPFCQKSLKVIGSRRRVVVNESGEPCSLTLRRLRCTNPQCGRIHHELPDILTPYKRQTTSTLEKIIIQDVKSVPVENSTILRISNWFKLIADSLVGGLLSTYITVFQDYGVDLSDLPQSILDRIFFFVGESPGWLKKTVQILVNNNRWPHTQLA